MKGLVAVVAAALLVGEVRAAHATPITFAEHVTATGSLGGSAFTNAPVTIQLFGDTATVNASPIPHDFGTATVSISNLATATLTDPLIWAFDNPAIQVAGIADVTQSLLILDTTNPAFATYDLRTAIGPLSGAAGFNAGQVFPTTLGNFTLTSIAQNTSSFSAVTSVPEPSTFILIGVGLAGAVSRQRLRRSRCVSERDHCAIIRRAFEFYFGGVKKDGR